MTDEALYDETVQLIREAARNQDAAGHAMFDGGGPEPGQFRDLNATVRQSEDAVLRGLLRLAESDHPRSAQRAFEEARGDWMSILLRAFETLPDENVAA